MVESQFHSTTICAVEKNGKFAMAGDGQVTMGESVVMKGTARKYAAFTMTKWLSVLLEAWQMLLL